MTTCIALLRGINVGGHNKIPMAELRSLCADLGWSDVQSYIQSGNLVFNADNALASLEAELEGAIDQHFGLTIPVIVRTATQWQSYVLANPYPDVPADESKFVMLCLSKKPPTADAAARLQERATKDERIAQVADVLWIHYAGGVGRSKLTPALLDRFAGSSVTARNWRTVLKLDELARR